MKKVLFVVHTLQVGGAEKVLINYETVLKPARKILIGDKIIIRGKGKFIVDGILGNTRKNNITLKINKYI